MHPPHFVPTLQVRELQLQAMLASTSSSQDSIPAAGKTQPASTGCDASKPATDLTRLTRHGNADSAAAAAAAAAVGTVGDMAAGSSDSAAAAVGTVGGASAEDTAELGSLRAEVDRLQTERGVLAAKLGDAQQQLAEARKAIDQKEGHLQGLQVSFCPLMYIPKPAPLWSCALPLQTAYQSAQTQGCSACASSSLFPFCSSSCRPVLH